MVALIDTMCDMVQEPLCIFLFVIVMMSTFIGIFSVALAHEMDVGYMVCDCCLRSLKSLCESPGRWFGYVNVSRLDDDVIVTVV